MDEKRLSEYQAIADDDDGIEEMIIEKKDMRDILAALRERGEPVAWAMESALEALK